MMVIPRSLREASAVPGAASCSTSPIARLPPAPESVTDVLDPVVLTIVPSAVVVPELILFSVKVVLAAALVPANATVPARLGAMVRAIAQGTLTTADAAGLPLNGNVTGTDCTALGICAYVTDAP